MKALYRKYRPTSLEEVVGQEQVTKVLDSSLKAGKIQHAYLFVGPRGCGKTSVARIFAHAVNGFKYELEDDYVDIIEIDGASNRGIDNIRELREKVMIAPTTGKYKVYIIDEVHMLTKEAFNALLKTLEEPPEHAIFIMATTDFYKVPVTIVSRAQTYTFKLADPNTMLAHLKGICEKEGIKIEDDALSVIVKRGGGSFRDSLSLLDQISTLSQDLITKDLVVSALGLPETEKVSEILNAATNGDVALTGNLIKESLATGIKPETIAEELINQILAEPRPEYLPLLAKLPEVRAPFAEAKLLTTLCLKASSVTQAAFVAARPTMPTTGVRPAVAPAPSVASMQAMSATPTPATAAPAPVQAAPTPAIESPAPAAKPAPAPVSGADFDWEAFLERAKALNDAVAMQARKCQHLFDGNTLTLYPDKNITKTILSRDGNKKILIEAGGGVKITIAEVGDTPNAAPKDELLSKISDIMGGKVENDGQGGNPF